MFAILIFKERIGLYISTGLEHEQEFSAQKEISLVYNKKTMNKDNV